MVLPLVLIFFATAAAALVAYGVHPDLAQYANGLALIVLSRRLMWPAVVLSLALCISLLGLVISGKRRAWWLIGLAPVLALFVHRFRPGAPGPSAVVEQPTFVRTDMPGAPEAGDYVVGFSFEGKDYALPYRALFVTPVVSITDYDKRMLLIWSAFANRATAVEVARGEMKARDLEVVSSPANSLLVYDKRLGQFICGVTGRRTDGSAVVGFGAPISTEKTTWATWKAQHRETLVMLPVGKPGAIAAAPTRPILPQYKLRIPPEPDPATPVALLATTRPAAISTTVERSRDPLNVSVGGTRIVMLHDRAGTLRAFDRHATEDLFLSFSAKSDRKHPEVAMTDADTGSVWTADGHAIDGPLKGTKLREIELDDGLYWGVMKHWYPELELVR